MVDYQTGGRSVYDIKYHFVWVTKYRYHVPKDEVATRAREMIRQCCFSRDITIIKGSVGKDHIHLLVSCPATMAPAKVVQYLKGRSSRLLQQEFSHLKKRYWGQHLWARGYFCATVGAVNEETIRRYIEGQQMESDDAFDIEDESSHDDRVSSEPSVGFSQW